MRRRERTSDAPGAAAAVVAAAPRAAGDSVPEAAGDGNDRVEQRERCRVLALQRRERVAAVAEDVEVGPAACASARRQRSRPSSSATEPGLVERLAAADGHAVEPSRDTRRHATARNLQSPTRRARPRVLRHAAAATDRAALQPQADAAPRPEHRHRPVRLVEIEGRGRRHGVVPSAGESRRGSTPPLHARGTVIPLSSSAVSAVTATAVRPSSGKRNSTRDSGLTTATPAGCRCRARRCRGRRCTARAAVPHRGRDREVTCARPARVPQRCQACRRGSGRRPRRMKSNTTMLSPMRFRISGRTAGT